MTPQEIVAAVTALSTLLTEATGLLESIKAAHTATAAGTTPQQLPAAAAAAAQAPTKLQPDSQEP